MEPRLCENVPSRALFIAAHPDDIEYVVAGTAIKWARAGACIRYVIVTRGDAGSQDPDMDPRRLAQIRMEEQREAARVSGVDSVHFLDHPDGRVEVTMALRRELVWEIRAFRPDVLVCFDPTPVFIGDDYVNHPDHRAVGIAALDAACPTSAKPLVFPEMRKEGLAAHRVPVIMVSTFVEPNCWVDITDTFERKIEALRCHASQKWPDWNPEPVIRQWAEEFGAMVGVPLAEAFRRIIWRKS